MNGGRNAHTRRGIIRAGSSIVAGITAVRSFPTVTATRGELSAESFRLNGSLSEVATTNTHFVVGSDTGYVNGYGIKSGTEPWTQTSINGGVVTSGLSSSDGRVFVATDRGELYGLDGETGAVEWSQRLTGNPRGVRATPDAVLAFDGDTGAVTRLSEDGSRVWVQSPPEETEFGYSPTTDPRNYLQRPLLTDTGAVVVTDQERVYAYSYADGSRLFEKRPVSRVNNIGFVNAVDDEGYVYVPTSEGLAKMNARTGTVERIWTEYQEWGYATYAGYSSEVFVLIDDRLSRIDRDTGDRLWGVPVTFDRTVGSYTDELLTITEGDESDGGNLFSSIDPATGGANIERTLNGSNVDGYTAPVRGKNAYAFSGNVASGSDYLWLLRPSSGDAAETADAGGPGTPSGQATVRGQQETGDRHGITGSTGGGDGITGSTDGRENGDDGVGFRSTLLTGIGVLVAAVLSIYAVLRRNQQT